MSSRLPDYSEKISFHQSSCVTACVVLAVGTSVAGPWGAEAVGGGHCCQVGRDPLYLNLPHPNVAATLSQDRS